MSTNSLQRIARSIAMKSNTSIKFSLRNEAYTDGNCITLPSLDLVTDKDILLGYLVHEIAHIRETNFNCDFSSPFFNALEDHRVERLISLQLRGANDFLIRTWTEVGNETLTKILNKSSSTAFSSVANYIIYVGQNVTLGRNTIPLALTEILKQDVMNHWGLIHNDLDNFLIESRYTKTTEDCILLSENIVSFLKNLRNFVPQKNRSGYSDLFDNNNSQGQPGDNSQDQPSDNSQDQPGDNSQGQSIDNSQGQSVDNSQDHNTNSFKACDLNTTLDNFKNDILNGCKSHDFSEIIKEKLSDVINESIEKFGYAAPIPDLSCRDVTETLCDESVLNDAKPVASSVMKVVKRLFESERHKKLSIKRSGVRINTSKITRVAVNDSRIFESSKMKMDIDTAITIAIDMSGSMSGDRSHKALASAYGISKAVFTTPKITCRLTVFPGTNSLVEQITGRNSKPSQSITGIKASGGTPLTEAVEEALFELNTLNVNRKVLIVITDGVVPPTTAMQINRILTDSDVEVCWIAICVESFPFQQSVIHIADPSNLGNALLNTLRNSI